MEELKQFPEKETDLLTVGLFLTIQSQMKVSKFICKAGKQTAYFPSENLGTPSLTKPLQAQDYKNSLFQLPTATGIPYSDEIALSFDMSAGTEVEKQINTVPGTAHVRQACLAMVVS